MPEWWTSDWLDQIHAYLLLATIRTVLLLGHYQKLLRKECLSLVTPGRPYVLQARSHAKHVHLEQDVRLTYFGNVHMSSQEISEGVMCE